MSISILYDYQVIVISFRFKFTSKQGVKSEIVMLGIQ